VVTAFDDAELGKRRQVPDDRRQFVRRAEDVPRTLDSVGVMITSALIARSEKRRPSPF
jgi:hypothetical protein